ncbi:MAG: hypothetical protein QXR76_03470 [Candidatus Bathyarchaeia archaeon]
MNPRTKLALFAVVCLLLGAFIGYMASGIISQAMLRPDHRELAEKVKVYDAVYKRYQNLRFERAGKSKMLSITPLFVYQEKEYDYSFWTFTYGDDINAVMHIWGPDENGKYSIEIAKLAGNRMDVTWPDGTTVQDILYAGKEF